jgi:hypothetical protein
MRTIVGVMGGAAAQDLVIAHARELGRLIAQKDWVLLCGGRDAGVMASAARGASVAGGLVVGILPGEDTAGVAPHVDVAIPTGMGDARNVINVLASHAVVALRGGAGTLSEVALALKSGRTVITLGFPLGQTFSAYYDCGQLIDAHAPDEALRLVTKALAEVGR